MKYLMQVIAYGAFMAIVGVLSVWPKYELLDDDWAIISLAYSHAGKRIGECRRLTQEELDELAPNMRKPIECPRKRHPINVEFHADGLVLYRDILPPSGLWADGKATVYRRLQVRAGERTLFIGMNDSGGGDGFDHEMNAVQTISSGQNLVIDFDEVQQKFVFR